MNTYVKIGGVILAVGLLGGLAIDVGKHLGKKIIGGDRSKKSKPEK